MAWLNPLAKARRQMMAELLRVIRDVKNVDLDWLMGFGGKAWGLTEGTLMRMLQQLEKAGDIELYNQQHMIVYTGHPKSAKAKEDQEPQPQGVPEEYRLPSPPKKVALTKRVKAKDVEEKEE